jgi:Tfp pilus assembly protein PilF
MTQLPIAWRYLGLFVAPVGLSLAHSAREIGSPFDPVFVLALAATLGVVVLAWRARRSRPAETFGAVWFALLLVPSSLVPLAEHMSEHRVYEASAGLFLAAGAAWSRVRAPRLQRAVPAALAIVLALASIARNRDWADPITLWQRAVAEAPDLWTAHYALANEYQYASRCDDALPEYARAIKLKASQRAVVNTGVCLAQLGRYDDAERVLETALRLGPGVDPHFNLGLLAIARDRPDEARAHFLAVLALDDRNLPARKALVDLYETRLPNPGEAARLCREIQQLAPWTAGLERCLR